MKRLVALLASAALLTALAGCASQGTAFTHPAATTVEELLTLRADGSAGAADYERFFKSAEIAQQLAVTGGDGSSSVPEWDPPYVSRVTSLTAEVLVRWHEEPDGFPGWPEATVFVLEDTGDAWVVKDAQLPEGELPPPLGE